MQDGGADSSLVYLPKPITGLPGGTVGFFQTPGGYPTGPTAVEEPWVATDEWTSHPLPVGFSLLWMAVVALLLAQAARKATHNNMGSQANSVEQQTSLDKADVRLALVLTGVFVCTMLFIATYFFETRQTDFWLFDCQFLSLWCGIVGVVVATVVSRIMSTPSAPDQTAHTDNVLSDGRATNCGRQTRRMRALGYRTSTVGAASAKAVVLGCVLWIFVIFAVLFDFYNGCQLTGVDNLCFFGDYVLFGGWTTNSEVLFQSWWLMLFWFLPLVALRGKISTFFVDRCRLCDAEFVWIWVPDQDEGTKNVVSATPFVLIVRRLRELFGLFSTTTGGHDGIVHVETSPQGCKFFVFECTRYMISPEGDHFETSNVKYSNTYSQMHGKRNGLTAADYTALLDQCGENTIPFEVATWGDAVVAEFLSVFYLYQFLIYYVVSTVALACCAHTFVCCRCS